MSSFAPWIILILIVFFFVGKIYRDLKQGRSKCLIILQVILLLGIIGFFVVSQNRIKNERQMESGGAESTNKETTAEAESGRVTNLLSGLQDYFGELNRTDNPGLNFISGRAWNTGLTGNIRKLCMSSHRRWIQISPRGRGWVF